MQLIISSSLHIASAVLSTLVDAHSFDLEPKNTSMTEPNVTLVEYLKLDDKTGTGATGSWIPCLALQRRCALRRLNGIDKVLVLNPPISLGLLRLFDYSIIRIFAMASVSCSTGVTV